jgi:hypothetical protein
MTNLAVENKDYKDVVPKILIALPNDTVVIDRGSSALIR